MDMGTGRNVFYCMANRESIFYDVFISFYIGQGNFMSHADVFQQCYFPAAGFDGISFGQVFQGYCCVIQFIYEASLLCVGKKAIR